jgi:hypothetical protein
MENLHLSPKQKNILFIIFIFFTFLMFYLTFVITESSGKYSFTVALLPADSTIRINGVVSSNQTSLYPGVYEVTVEKDGFSKDTQTITVEKDFAISSFLSPVSDEAKKWVNDNFSLYPEGYDPTTNRQPILNQLPYQDLIFSMSIDENSVDKTPLPLTIESLTGYSNSPIDKIREMGYSPEDYTYRFDFENPFKSGAYRLPINKPTGAADLEYEGSAE